MCNSEKLRFMSSYPLEGVLRKSEAEQITVHKVSGGIWIILGALFVVLSVFVRGKESEQGMRVVAGILGALSIGFGVWYMKWMIARTRAFVELLLKRSPELKKPEIIVTRAGGRPIGYVIALSDSLNRRHKLKVPSEADARAILGSLPG